MRAWADALYMELTDEEATSLEQDLSRDREALRQALAPARAAAAEPLRYLVTITDLAPDMVAASLPLPAVRRIGGEIREDAFWVPRIIEAD